MTGHSVGRGLQGPAVLAMLGHEADTQIAALVERVRTLTVLGLPAIRTGGFFRRWTVDRAAATVRGDEQSDLTGAEVALLALGYHYGLAVGLLSETAAVPQEIADRAWSAAVAAFRTESRGQQAA